MKIKYYILNGLYYLGQNGLTDDAQDLMMFDSPELAISVGQRYFNHFAVQRETYDQLKLVDSSVYARVDKGVVQTENVNW